MSLAYQLVSIGLIVPLLQRLTNAPLDVSQFAALRGNAPALLGALALAWLIGAFAEELVYRGYVLNRFADLAGPRPAGWARGLLGSAALFGWGHLYQGPSGVAETFLFGCAMAAVYLATQSNLWAAILAHGVNNTIGLFLIYLGLYP